MVGHGSVPCQPLLALTFSGPNIFICYASLHWGLVPLGQIKPPSAEEFVAVRVQRSLIKAVKPYRIIKGIWFYH